MCSTYCTKSLKYYPTNRCVRKDKTEKCTLETPFFINESLLHYFTIILQSYLFYFFYLHFYISAYFSKISNIFSLGRTCVLPTYPSYIKISICSGINLIDHVSKPKRTYLFGDQRLFTKNNGKQIGTPGGTLLIFTKYLVYVIVFFPVQL